MSLVKVELTLTQATALSNLLGAEMQRRRNQYLDLTKQGGLRPSEAAMELTYIDTLITAKATVDTAVTAFYKEARRGG